MAQDPSTWCVAPLPTLSERLLSSLARATIGSGPTAWACLPEIALMIEAPHDRPPAAPLPATVARTVRRSVARSAGPRLVRTGPVLFVDTSVQIRRVLEPVVDELAVTYGTQEPFRLARLRARDVRGAVSAASSTTEAFRAWFDAQAVPPPPSLREDVLKVEVLRRRAERTPFDREGIRAIVVGTQHNGSTRALLAVAADLAELTTIYVPHAPVALNAYYADLPVDVALLRGPAEVAHYQGLGVGSLDHLVVVGDPGTPAEGREPPAATHVVYAASTHSEELVRADAEVVSRAVDRPVLVSLHALMHGSSVRTWFPQEWRVLPPAPTITNVRNYGAHVLIQHGSGVGLEAMHAGIDVIDLCASNERPNYAYIVEPHVQLAFDAGSLWDAVDAVPERRASRLERTEFARSWSIDQGSTAAKGAAASIQATVVEPQRSGWLLDGWRQRAAG